MSSVDRALSLLGHFTLDRPEWGLSELAREAGMDKTTALRCLNALERNGFVEQHPETRKYRLGFAPLHLARIREQAFPVTALLQPILDQLSEATGETAHASLITHRHLVTIAVSEPRRATRVFVDPSAPLPVHATASGLAVLSAMPVADWAQLDLGEALETFTEATPKDRADLEARVAEVRATGCARARRTFEHDVVGTAVPLFGWSGRVLGAVAVAAVASRFDDAAAARIEDALRRASNDLSQQLGR